MSTSARIRDRAGLTLLAALLRWSPAAVLIAYLAVLGVTFNRVAGGVFLNADAASGPVIGELLSSAPPGREVLLGNYPWYETLWLELATKSLPLHRQLWEALPYALVLAGAVALGWSVWRIAGAWSAVLAIVPVVCAAEGYLGTLASPNSHGYSIVHATLAGAFLVWARADNPSRLAFTAAVVALTAVTGAGVASDSLVVVTVVSPLVLTAAVLALVDRSLRSRLLAGVIALVAVLSVIIGTALIALMEHDHIARSPFQVAWAGADRLFTSASILVSAFGFLAGGQPFGAPIGFVSSVQMLCVVAAVAGVVAAVSLAFRSLRATAAATATGNGTLSAEGIHTVYWGWVLVATIAAFVLTSVPVDVYSSRYLLPAWVAVAALLPLVARRSMPAKLLVTAGVVLVGCVGLVTLVRGDIYDGSEPSLPARPDIDALAAFAKGQGLRYGYATYWDAAPITHATREDVEVFPVQECGTDHALCAWQLHTISTWYQPRRNTPSFVVVDPLHPEVTGVSAALGRPEAVRTFGRFTVYVFPFDVAKRIGPPVQ